MDQQNLQAPDLMFGDLLEKLSSLGFSIGVDSHLSVQRLLGKVSGSCTPEDLRTLLCPVLAKNKKQQRLFYALFDDYFRSATPPAKQAAPESSPEEARGSEHVPFSARPGPYLIAGVLLTGIIGWTAYYRAKQAQIPVPPQIVLSPTSTPMPMNSVRTRLTTETPKEWAQAILWLAIFGPPVFFLLYEWYLYNRRTLLLRKLRSRNQPYVLPVRPDPPQRKLFESEQFYSIARQLRVRQQLAFHRLNIERTINATIQSVGFPTLRFKRSSRVPEYLALIERTSQRDHQSRLFAELVRALEKEAVDIERYYFDDDPRVCFKLSHLGDEPDTASQAERKKLERGINLQDLIRPDDERRLLIFSKGDALVDPITGAAAGWTIILRKWKERALLTPVSPEEWGRREFTLSQELLVVPATIDGLQALVDCFELSEMEGVRKWAKKAPALPPSDFDDPEILDSLRDYLGPESFQWLCACAIYPRLQWDLTLYIGGLPCMPSGLVTAENLVRLIRLDWFQTSLIPERVRQLLIRELDPDIEAHVRKAIVELIKETSPNKLLTDPNPLNVAVPRAFFEAHREKLKKALAALPPTQVTRDATLARFLESRPNRFLDLVVPRALMKLFFPHGNSALRMRTSARILFVLLLMLSLSLVAPRLARALKTKERLVVENGPDPTPSVMPSPIVSATSSPLPSPELSPTQRPSTTPVVVIPSPTAPVSSTPSPSPMPSLNQELITYVHVALLTQSGGKQIGYSVRLSVTDSKTVIGSIGPFGNSEVWERGDTMLQSIKLSRPTDLTQICRFGIAIDLRISQGHVFPQSPSEGVRYVSTSASSGITWGVQVEVVGESLDGRRLTLLSRSRTYQVEPYRPTYIAFPCSF
jgi:hypothetical protein